MKSARSLVIASALAGLAGCNLSSAGLASGTAVGTASGGMPGVGGATRTGGGPGSGGSASTGGSASLGGTIASGGTTGFGGEATSGGAAETGGSAAVGTGGSGTGGASTGGASTGGASTVGSGTGGAGTAGSGTGGSGTGGGGGSTNPDAADDRPIGTGDAPADTAPDAPADFPANFPDTRDLAAPDTQTMTLVWSDEFNGPNGTGVDLTKWSYITWNPGQVNNEVQKYTSRLANVFQNGAGQLVIRALNTPYSGFQYTSGRIESNGTLPFSFKFGRIEVRAKLPAGIGSFPGIVMLGTSGNWPTNGELVLMEQWGVDKSWFNVNATAGGQIGSGSGDTGNVRYTYPDPTTASSGYHVYSLDWHTDYISFQVDGVEITRTTYATSSPFYAIPEYIVLDLALGGDMGGTIPPTAVFPMEMLVDYVRVYSF